MTVRARRRGSVGRSCLGWGLVVALTVAWRGGAAGVEPRPSTARAHGPNRAGLSPARFEAGDVPQDQPFGGEVALRNDGPNALVLVGIDRSRFCEGRALATEVAAHASVPVRIACRADLSGPLREQLVVHARVGTGGADGAGGTNQPDAPDGGLTATLEIVATVVPPLAFGAATVDLVTPFGQSRAAEVRLTGPRAAAAQLDLPRATSGAVDGWRDVEVVALPRAGRRAAGVRLRCRGDRVGVHVGYLTVPTGLEHPAALGLSWSCRVRGTLTVAPDNVYLDLADPDGRARLIDVTSTQPGFAIKQVAVTAGPFVAARDDVVATRVRVAIDRAAALAAGDLRGATGTLVIITNDRSEPRKEVPIYAVGSAGRYLRTPDGGKP